VIRLDGVSKVYQTSEGPVRALDHVDLEIDAGEFVAVRGPSGCGKSTLLAIVGGLHSPTSGKVVVDGEEISAKNSAARAAFRAEKVGFVFQMFHLLPYLTVTDNVMLSARPGQESAARRRAVELLERFQLGHRLSHHPGQLSTGERQRVAMARAMMNDPSLILADEPTGNLDPENATAVLDHLAEFQRQGGTVLLVTHEEVAAGYAGRTVALRDGLVAAEPTAVEGK